VADMPNPAGVELVDGVFMLVTPCCVTAATLPETSDLTAPHQVLCPLCEVRWAVAVRQCHRHGLWVSWTPPGSPT